MNRNRNGGIFGRDDDVGNIGNLNSSKEFPFIVILFSSWKILIGLGIGRKLHEEFPIAAAKFLKLVARRTRNPARTCPDPYVIKHLFSRLEPVSHVLPTTWLPCHSFSDRGHLFQRWLPMRQLLSSRSHTVPLSNEFPPVSLSPDLLKMNASNRSK